jgi:phosphoribosylformimino-5-aminoimidazole carboxamide ribotide isomerase
MRIIPVLDLLHGQSVHAIKGERAKYQPVKSVLCDSSDPLAIARSFRDGLGLREIYVADLDAIQGLGKNIHRHLIAALAHQEKMDVILDAGISDVSSAEAMLDLGVRKVIIGSETLQDPHALQDFPAKIGHDHLTFSLDSHSGTILSRCASLSTMNALEIMKHLQQFGWKEVILLDLDRVGSSTGTDFSLAARVLAEFPNLQLLVGGGIANLEELVDLKTAGIAGVLLATVLHSGIVGAQNLSCLRGDP